VALGTDGFPSDMRAEADALIDEGARYHESRDNLLRRLDAGHALARELFGTLDDECEFGPDGRVSRLTIAGRQVVRDATLQTGDLEEIRHHAQEIAPHLWQRMAGIS
jgi:hypothetical protein